MGFNCTPSELIEYLLRRLAFSGNNGLSLKELWAVCGDKMGKESPDDFEKHIVWQWLFRSDMGASNLFIWQNNKQITLNDNYKQFVGTLINEDTVRIFPSSETQWKYLMGQNYSKKLKTQLGDYPFQLLCEIGKSGPQGIYASDLSKATNQDPRSLTLRLKKLEDLNLINKTSVYNPVNKQHTSLCVHKCFQNSEIDFSLLEFSDDIKYSRDAEKLRHLIMLKIKQAPNGLRSLGDLKNELSLGKNRSISKFYRGIVESLCRKGYLEKVNVRSTDNDNAGLIYCVKYIKDLRSNSNVDHDNIHEILHENYENDKTSPEENHDNNIIIPKFNDFFPMTTQIYRCICMSKSASSMEISRILVGNSGFRPMIRFLETITTYVNDNNKLKLVKNYKDPYEGLGITRTYDFEGKFKFYRYSVEAECEIVDKSPTKSAKDKLASSKSLAQLNKKLFKSLGKIPKGNLLSNKRKMEEPTGPKRTNKKRKTRISVDNDDPSLAKGSNNQPHNNITEEIDVGEEDQLPTRIISPPANFQIDTKRNKVAPVSSNASIKSIRRREALIEIIKEHGGVTFTSAQLRRELDKRLGSSTLTDMKTLVRDVVALVQENVIEARDIKTIRTGQSITRKLLVLMDPELRPSEERIEEAQRACESNENKVPLMPAISPKIIRADVTLYSRSIAKGRLDGLGSRVERKKRVKVEPDATMKGRKSRKKIDDNEAVTKTQYPLSALVGNRFKGKKTTNRKPSEDNNKEASVIQRKTRVPEFNKADTSLLFKLVVMSRSFRKMIVFEDLTKHFDNINGKDLKQKWTTTRRRIGGLNVVLRSMEQFEHIVSKQTEAGIVRLEHLQEPIDFSFFLNLWDKSGGLNGDDLINELYLNLKDNYSNYDVIENTDSQTLLFEQLERISMRQKELIMCDTVFYHYQEQQIQYHQEEEQIKTTLKAIFATEKANFESQVVTNILSPYGNEKIQAVLTNMMRDREALYKGMEVTGKSFTLTDKFDSALISMNTIPEMFHEAKSFFESSNELFKESKGVLLSQGIRGSHMIPLFNLVSQNSIELLHINKPFKFNGYESRLIDRSRVDCDIIISGELGLGNVVLVPIPTGKAASNIWLDLNGNINRDLWIRIVVSILWYVVFRPGVQKHVLYGKFKPALSFMDLSLVIDWLKQSNCLKEGTYNDYWVHDTWYTVIG